MKNNRIVYCKNGDVVDELAKLSDNCEIVGGGPEHYISSFLNWAAGNKCLLISANTENKELQRGDVNAVVFRRNGREVSSANRLLGEIFLIGKIIYRIVKFRPTQILCASGGPPMYACFLAAKLVGAVLVCSRHGSVSPVKQKLEKRVMVFLDKKVLKNSDGVICHGRYLYEELIDVGVKESRLLEFNLSYSYILKEMGQSAVELPKLVQSCPIKILYVGRIRRDKGALDLVEAMKPILEKYSHVGLVIAGYGEDQKKLQERIAEIKDHSRIVFLGKTPHDAVLSLYRQCSVTVTPTHRTSTESRCKVAVESFVCGTPVVAPKFGPFNYLVEDGVNGLFYHPENIADLTGKLETLILDEKLLNKLGGGAKTWGSGVLESKQDYIDVLPRVFAVGGR